MATWLTDITSALANLGGIAHYSGIYTEVARIRGVPLPGSWKQVVQRTIQDHSPQSQGFKGDEIFYSVDGIGSGVWGLRSALNTTPPASDLGEPGLPARVLTQTYRILRDTDLARKLKALHKDECQVCGLALALRDGSTYSEAHHIQPLGMPHSGPDVAANIVVLCPNHHVLFDYGAVSIFPDNLRTVMGHHVGEEYVAYHNEMICTSGSAV